MKQLENEETDDVQKLNGILYVSTHILEDKRKICNRIPLGFPFSSNNNQDIIEKETYNESISKGKKH